MMKLVLFGGIAFVLGAVGSTGFVVMRAPAPKEAPVAAAPADSAAAVPGAEAPAAAAGTAAPATQEGTPAGTPPPAAAAGADRGSGGDSETTRRAVVGDLMEPDGAALADSCRAIAKILAAMKPADAAKILAHLSDDQVEGILRASGVRQAGILLAQLTPERGAAMSRRLIIRREGKKP